MTVEARTPPSGAPLVTYDRDASARLTLAKAMAGINYIPFSNLRPLAVGAAD